MELTFLDNIEIEEELKGKEDTIKSIRFSKDEYYMLKYCKYKNKKFSVLVKELLNESIKNEGESFSSDIDIAKIKEELKEELKKELLKELGGKTEEIKETSKTDNEAKQELADFMNKRK